MVKIVESLFKWFGLVKGGKIKKAKERAEKYLVIPVIFTFVIIVRTFLSFVGWIKAILISWGILDGVISYGMYKEEKFFPYQFIRFGRIAANLSGIIFPLIPFVWNVADGIYSLIIYERAHPTEHLSRVGRVSNGILLLALS